jgi:hypothetical protein
LNRTKNATWLLLVSATLAADSGHPFHFGDARRIAAAQHVNPAARCWQRGFAEIQHQLERAGGPQDSLPEPGCTDLHRTVPACIAHAQVG